MNQAIEARRPAGPAWRALDLAAAAALAPEEALARLGSRPEGLAAAEAERRLDEVGPNALRSHG
ncbi:MAG TPA: cation-transporting P-type ATPase, partial [Gemmatimonadales bacterium]|nr:cation-transporting P-type ATPase [Gemmatimonadales bacterium]